MSKTVFTTNALPATAKTNEKVSGNPDDQIPLIPFGCLAPMLFCLFLIIDFIASLAPFSWHSSATFSIRLFEALSSVLTFPFNSNCHNENLRLLIHLYGCALWSIIVCLLAKKCRNRFVSGRNRPVVIDVKKSTLFPLIVASCAKSEPAPVPRDEADPTTSPHSKEQPVAVVFSDGNAASPPVYRERLTPPTSVGYDKCRSIPIKKNEASGKMRNLHRIFFFGVFVPFATFGQDCFVELGAQRHETTTWPTAPATSDRPETMRRPTFFTRLMAK